MTAATVGGQEFLTRFFRDCPGTNSELRVLDIQRKETKIVFRKGYVDVALLVKDAARFAKRYNLYFNTAALNGGFSEEHAVAVPALRIDFDFKHGITEAEARQMLAAFPLPPSAIVHTGGGLHVYWFLAEPVGPSDFALVKSIIKALAFTFRADTNACDIPRILRIPGSANFKPEYDPPRPVTLSREDWHPEREFALSDFVALLPVEGNVQTPPAEKMTEEAGGKLPLELLGPVYEKCAELEGMRRNAIEAGRLLPEDQSGEHLARIRMANLYRAFDGGQERCVRDVLSHLEDYDPKETEKQLASLRGAPPPCAELCPAGQCDAIKTLGKQSPIAFAYEARREARKAEAPAIEAPSEDRPPFTEKFRATDLWAARLFAFLHGQQAKHCGRRGGWFVYDGRRWAESECGEIERLAKELPKAILELALAEPEAEQRAKMFKFAAAMESASRIAAVLTLAATEEGIALPPDAFDADPWAFNVQNGTIDLRSGEIRPHRPEDLITNVSPAGWRGIDAKAPLFERFISEAMDGEEEKIGFLRRRAGYTVTGDMREQVFFFDHGPEAAGKGTENRAEFDVMGSYARATDIATFLTARRDGVRNDIASLVGSRMVLAGEPEDGQVFDEGLIKILTGQDRTRVRFLFREAFETEATFKIRFQGNHRPHIRSTGGAMWRRLFIVPFTRTVPEEKRDKLLGEKLKSPDERAGILAWMVRGALEWQRDGLRPPASVRAAVADYRNAEDRLAPFLEDRCEVGEFLQVTAGGLYGSYKAWCESAGERPMSQRSLGLRLEEKGFEKIRTYSTGRGWRGLALLGHDAS